MLKPFLDDGLFVVELTCHTLNYMVDPIYGLLGAAIFNLQHYSFTITHKVSCFVKMRFGIVPLPQP